MARLKILNTWSLGCSNVHRDRRKNQVCLAPVVQIWHGIIIPVPTSRFPCVYSLLPASQLGLSISPLNHGKVSIFTTRNMAPVSFLSYLRTKLRHRVQHLLPPSYAVPLFPSISKNKQGRVVLQITRKPRAR